MWGVAIAAVVATCFVVGYFWERVVDRVLFCCGVDHRQKDWARIMERRHGRYSAAMYVLTACSSLWLVVGVGVVGFCVYTLLPGTPLLWDAQYRQVCTRVSSPRRFVCMCVHVLSLIHI